MKISNRGWIRGIVSSVIVLGFLSLISVRPAMADQIYVCTGCTTAPGGDPNVINPASINVGFDGNHTAVAPLLMIVGVPKSGPAPTISLPTGVIADTSGKYYGLNFATSGSTSGVFESSLSMGGEAYASSGLKAGANSELFSNWNTYDTAQGISDGGKFSLYAYAIDFALNNGKGGNSPINIDFSGTTAGSFVIAYACETSEPLGTACPKGEIGNTPFTNSGVVNTVTPVPEPATLTLFGSGLIAMAGLIRRRRST